MAILAPVAEFALMLIVVAIRTQRRQFVERGFGMASIATHRRVVTDEAVTCQLVVEFYIGFELIPSGGGMALHAFDTKAPVALRRILSKQRCRKNYDTEH